MQQIYSLFVGNCFALSWLAVGSDQMKWELLSSEFKLGREPYYIIRAPSCFLSHIIWIIP